MEVVRDLCEDARPVDAVDSRERMRAVHVGVAEQRLHEILAVVEGAIDGEVVHVGVEDGRHLRFLHGRHFAGRVHDEDGDVTFVAQAVDGGAAGIAGGCADDCEVAAGVGGGGIAVAAHEEVLEEVAEELEGDVFEGEGGAVEELEEVDLRFFVEGHDGRDFGGAEGRVAAVDDVFEVFGRDFAGGDVEGEDVVGELGEGEVWPGGGPGGG